MEMNVIEYIKKEVVPRTDYDFTKTSKWIQIPTEEYCLKLDMPHIKYNPKIDFQYATSNRCISDGTFLFRLESVEKVFDKIIKCQTFYKGIDLNKIHKVEDFQYLVGDVVQCIEHGDFGTEEKPWLHERITTFLPIKMIIKEK